MLKKYLFTGLIRSMVTVIRRRLDTTLQAKIWPCLTVSGILLRKLLQSKRFLQYA